MFGKEKILVEIITDAGVKKKKLVKEGNFVIVKAGKGVRGDPKIKAEFDRDCILTYKNFLGFVKQKLMLKEGHKKCVKFHGQRTELSYFNVKGFFEAGVVRNFGSTIQTLKAPLILYLLSAGSLAIGFITLLVLSGRLSI